LRPTVTIAFSATGAFLVAHVVLAARMTVVL